MSPAPALALLFFCASLWSCGEKTRPDQPGTVEKGKEAPDFSFTDLSSGRKGNLSDFKGKVVVVEFWWSKCAFCGEKMDHLQETVAKHPEWKDKVVFLAVSVDPTMKDAKDHVAKREWSRTQNSWHDAKGGESAIYQSYVASRGTPVSYVIDRIGVIREIETVENELDLPKVLEELLGDTKGA